MKRILFGVIALLLIMTGVYLWWIFFISSAGHPPDTNLGFGIVPASFFGAGVSTYTAMIFAKAARHGAWSTALTQARALPWKLAKLTLAFTCSILSTIIFSGIFLGGIGRNTEGDQWVTGLLVLLCAVTVGVFVYRKFRIWS